METDIYLRCVGIQHLFYHLKITSASASAECCGTGDMKIRERPEILSKKFIDKLQKIFIIFQLWLK
jgi:hypothetical protein